MDWVVNVTPIDDVRLYVKASDNDDGIRLDDSSGNSLFKVFQQGTNVGRLTLGNGRTVDLGDVMNFNHSINLEVSF